VFTVSQRKLAQVLNISERAVRKRSGITLPVPVKGQYQLCDVLWYLALDERRRVASVFQVDLEYLHTMFVCSLHNKE